MTVGELSDYFAAEVEEGLFGPGGQLCVVLDDVLVLDLGLGFDALGSPVDATTLFAIYCAGKPTIAAAIACLVDDGELSFDDAIGDIIERLPVSLARVRVEHLLNHTGGMHSLFQGQYMGTSTSKLDKLVESSGPPNGWQCGVQLGYSEVAGVHLLGRIIENLSGEEVRTFVRRRVLEPSGCADEMFIGGMTEDEFVQSEPKLGVNVWLTGLTGDPLLTERTRRQRCAPNVSVGASASARGLVRFYAEMLRAHRGQSGVISQRVFAQMVARSATGYDQVFGRECSYGLGFMVDLGSHHYGPMVGATSFGHSGNGGMTAAFCDPDRNLVVAYHLDGRTDAATALAYHRPAFVSRIYRALDLE